MDVQGTRYLTMSEVEKQTVAEWKADYNWLAKRLDRMETEMSERIVDLKKKVKLLVRILVDKKIVGEEIAKSIEESTPEDEKLAEDKLIEWFLAEREKKE